MQIYNTPNLYLNRQNYNVQFKTAQALKSAKTNVSNGIEYSMRVVGNKVADLFQSKTSKEITRSIAQLTPAQNAFYLAQLAEISRLYSTNKIIDVNIEDGILENLAKKGDSTIFIMNHSNQSEDPQMLGVLNTLLTEAYKKVGAEKFPLPKIIMNEDILKTTNPTKRKAFENFGAVGIDANLSGADKSVNTRAFFPLVKDFVRNNCNIFIFPEGRLAVRKDLELFDRFQPGVASLINKILALKKEVTVVPVGFAYGKGKQKGLNSMNIGTPLIIKREGEATSITKGDIEKSKESVLYGFFDKHKDETDVVITSEGKPVQQSEIPEYLKTILAENLEINSKLAEDRLKEPLDNTNFDML
jgi:hypothetical protein